MAPSSEFFFTRTWLVVDARIFRRPCRSHRQLEDRELVGEGRASSLRQTADNENKYILASLALLANCKAQAVTHRGHWNTERGATGPKRHTQPHLTASIVALFPDPTQLLPPPQLALNNN